MKRLVIALLGAAMMTSVVLPSQASNPLGTYSTVDTVIPPSTASWGLLLTNHLLEETSTPSLQFMESAII